MPDSRPRTVWCERTFDSARVEGLVATGKVSELLARLLDIRGISAADLDFFLNPSLAGLAKATDLPGIAEATEVILDAVAAKRKIVVFGDYDCDGVCATAILVKTLEAFGAKVKPFIPERMTEGYGMSRAAVDRMLRENPEVALVVTVDNGIGSVDFVRELEEKGIRVVVTDHHLPTPVLPPASALVNPKVSAPPMLDTLCGAGVAFFLANSLTARAKVRGLYTGPSIAGPLLILAGLATVTDIMPLKGQNRMLVIEALRRFRKFAPIGLLELYDRAGRTGVDSLVAKDFGFLIGPRINAAGRMASGFRALELILERDREAARELARVVDTYNTERKTVEQKMTESAMEQVIAGAHAQVISLPDGHPGVAGIVAARVLERLEVPVPVFVAVGSHGSARAPEGYNLRDAMEAASDALVRFGGHAAAGGFSVKPGELERFRELLNSALAKERGESAAVATIRYDLEVTSTDLTLAFAEELSRLEPFGEGNSEPLFYLRGVTLADVRPLGYEGKHLALSFRDRKIPRAVWWGRGDLTEKLRADSSRTYDMLFTIEVSDYGERHAELRISDLR